MAGIIVAGWDPIQGPAVYNIPLGGSLHKQPYAIGGKKELIFCIYINIFIIFLGSGSTYIYGYCDAAFRPNMSQTDAEQFVTHGKIIICL